MKISERFKRLARQMRRQSPAGPKFASKSMLVLAMGFVGGLSGCGVDTETLYDLKDQVQAVAQAHSNQTHSVAGESTTDQGKNTATFQPPFPDRDNPFEYPGDAVSALPQSNASVYAASVRVIGFADVGEPRVVIKIDDTIYSPKTGQQIGPLEVVSINPPQVEFRHGTFSWTSSLHDRGKK